MILVRAAPDGAGKGTARMAVVLKINPGFDASYPWREIGTGTRPEPASGIDYYLAPADKGGEPVGRKRPGGAELHRGAGDRPERVRAAVRRAPGSSRSGWEDQAGAGRAAVHPGAGDLRGPGGGRAARQ